jgi:DNA-binding NarL/FixJ family response regulator
MRIVGPDETRMADPAIRVLIAVREGLLRAGLRSLLDHQDGVTVVAEAATGTRAVAEAQRAQPDVVVMDADLPGLDGIAATRRILAPAGPDRTAVVLLMTGRDDSALFAALRAGASALLLRDADPAALIEAVRVVADGETLLAPAFASRLVEDFRSRPDRVRAAPDQLEELTAREREVVELVACGLSNEEIADRLFVTRATAKTHVSRALCKLHARDRAQLVVLAYESGLVQPGPRWSAGEDASLSFAARIPRIDRSLGRPDRQRVAAA